MVVLKSLIRETRHCQAPQLYRGFPLKPYCAVGPEDLITVVLAKQFTSSRRETDRYLDA